MERVFDIEEEFGDSAVLSYYYGHLSPGDNPKLYKKLTTTLAKSIDAKLSIDDRGWLSPLFPEIKKLHFCFLFCSKIIRSDCQYLWMG